MQARLARDALEGVLRAMRLHADSPDVAAKALVLVGVLAQVRHRLQLRHLKPEQWEAKVHKAHNLIPPSQLPCTGPRRCPAIWPDVGRVLTVA